MVPSEAMRGNQVLLDSGGSLVVFGVPWLLHVSLSSLSPSSHHMAFSLCASATKFLLFILTPIILD